MTSYNGFKDHGKGGSLKVGISTETRGDEGDGLTAKLTSLCHRERLHA